jgi:hypothetical protein
MKISLILLFITICIVSNLYANGFKMIEIDSTLMKSELDNFPRTSHLSINKKGDLIFNLFEYLSIISNGKLDIDKNLTRAIDKKNGDTVTVDFKVIKLTDDNITYALVRNGSSYLSMAGSLYKMQNKVWSPVVSEITGDYKTKNPITGFDIDNDGNFWFVSAGRRNFYRYDGNELTEVYGVDTINPKVKTFYPWAMENGIKIIGDNMFYFAQGGLAKYNIINGRREMFIQNSLWSHNAEKPISTFKYKEFGGKFWFATGKPSLIGFDESGYEIIDFSGGKLDAALDNVSFIDDFCISRDGTYWISVRQDSSRLYHIFDKDSFQIHREIFSMHRSMDSLIPNTSNALAIEEAPNGTIYIITNLGSLLYYGENPLYVNDDTENDNEYGLWNIYPNPVKEQINVEILCNSDFNPNSISLDLYSYTGEKIKNINNYSLIMNKTSGKAIFQFDTPDVLKGFYFLSITIDGRTQARSVIIDK